MNTSEKEIFLRNYRKLLGLIFDDIYNDAQVYCVENNREITCRKGCTDCCSQFISVNVSHAALVADFLYANKKVMAHFRKGFDAWSEAFGKNIEASSVLGQLESYTTFAAAMKPYPQNLLVDYHKLDIPCPFLDDGECSIRVVRPVVCAAYFSVSLVEYCRPDSTVKPHVLEVLPPESYLKQMAKLSHRKLYAHQEPLPKLVHKIITKGLPAVEEEVGRLFGEESD